MTDTPSEVERPSPGRPRSEEAHRAILDATLVLLREVGFAGLTMEGVAARAKVGKATIYRRWPSKAPLVMEALSLLPDMHPADTGSLAGDLRVLLQDLVSYLKSTPLPGALPVLALERDRDPELAKILDTYIAESRKPVFKVLDQAIARGELNPNIDRELAGEIIIGPIITRQYFTGGELSADMVDPIVEAAMGGIAKLGRS